MIQFKVNARDFEKALKDYPEDLSKNLNIASKKSAVKAESIAKAEHRFTTRTGRLVKSIKGYGGVEITKSRGFLGFFKKTKIGTAVELVLHDEGSPLGTKYGKYVHEGQRSWGADKFIEKAMDKTKSIILTNWDEAIKRANRKF